MTTAEVGVECIGWISTLTFLISIVIPRRVRLHEWGMFTSVTTGVYAFYHGATAIWVKWLVAFFVHFYMRIKFSQMELSANDQREK
jgi:hypothetical protein